MAYKPRASDNERFRRKEPRDTRPSRVPLSNSQRTSQKNRYEFRKNEKEKLKNLADDRCLRCGITEVNLDLKYATACDVCNLEDEYKNCSDGCNITTDSHLEAHHILPKSRAEKEPGLTPEVVSSPVMAAYLCHDCHQIMDPLALNASRKELLELHNLGRKNLSIEMIRDLIRTAEPGSYSAQVFCVWYNRAVIIHNGKVENANNKKETNFYPQPPRTLLRTAQAKSLVREQQKREKSNSRGRRQPQGQFYELR